MVESDDVMPKKHIPFIFHGQENLIEVIYEINDNPYKSGFDVLNLPFDYNICIGYPTLHASVKQMKNTGYRRYCGWIQLVEREYFSSEWLDLPDESEISIDTDGSGLYFAFGYPAELYDAPCFNLNNSVKGTWTAYTYLVDIPSRMNGHKLSFLAGFKWGYTESIVKKSLEVHLLELIELDINEWNAHVPFMKSIHPEIIFA